MEKRIIYTNADGGMSVLTPAPNCGLTVEEIAAKDILAGISYEIVDVEAIPTDRTFRNAWEKSGATVTHNIDKSKIIAHEMRRIKRAEEFAPLDIKATIPAEAVAAEAARVVIRDKYAIIQVNIDNANTIPLIKAAMDSEE